MAQTGRKVSRVVRQLTSDMAVNSARRDEVDSRASKNGDVGQNGVGGSHMVTINEDVTNALLNEFVTLRAESGAYLLLDDVHDALHMCNIKIPSYKSRIIVESLRPTHADERISFDEFRELHALLKPEYDSGATYVSSLSKQDDVRTVQSDSHGGSATVHSVSTQEQLAFTKWLERQLQDDADCAAYLPFAPNGDDLYGKCTDGILLCKLVNLAQPDTIVEKAINQPSGASKQLSVYQKLENLHLALNSARALGCNIVNIGPDDLQRAKEHLLLGLVWQLIKIGLTRSISVAQRSDIVWMISEVRRETMATLHALPAASDRDRSNSLSSVHNGDAQQSAMHALSDFANLSPETRAQLGDEMRKLTPEEILVNWVNYHLLRAGSKRMMSNFTEDLRDSEIYALLLSRIAPADVTIDVEKVLGEKDLLRRAALVIQEAARFDAATFITPDSVVECNRNLNLAFIANLFNTYPAIDPATSSATADSSTSVSDYDELIKSWQTLFNVQDDETREERTYRNWMNSMGVDPFVNYLYTDLRDALVLLQLYQLIKPGVVDHKKVHYRFHPRRRFLEEVENCNYVVHLGRSELKFILVGIGGEDLHRGNVTLTLGLVWQVMRAYTLTMLASLMQKTGFGGSTLEKDIIDWANSKLRAAKKPRTVSGFQDLDLSDGRILLDLIEAIRPRSVKSEWVKSGYSDADKMANAKLAITLGRKIGAKIYALPEDIVDVRPKMMMTIFACLMIADLEGRHVASQ